MTGDKKTLFKVLDKLNERIFKDMEKSKVSCCKTLTIEIIGLTERKISKCFTNKYGLSNRNSIKSKSYELFNELLEREGKVRMIRTKISGLIRDNESKSKNKIFNLLDNLKNDYKEGILPNKKTFTTPSKPKSKTLSLPNLKENNEKNDSKTKIKENKKQKGRISKSAINKIKYKDNKKNKNIIKYKDILNLFTNMKKEKEKINNDINDI